MLLKGVAAMNAFFTLVFLFAIGSSEGAQDEGGQDFDIELKTPKSPSWLGGIDLETAAGLPRGLAWNLPARPWGDTFLPKPPRPADELEVVECDSIPADEATAFTCLQGIVNRKQPRIYTVRDEADRFWLEWHKSRGYIKGYTMVPDWTALVRKHSGEIRGAVAPDTALYRGNVVALNVAACEDLLVASPQTAQRLNLPVRIDLTGRFKTYAEAMRWLWKEYRGKINPLVADFLDPERARKGATTVDYSVQQRALMIWPPSDAEARLPGVDPVADLKALAEILSQMAPDGVVIGWPGGSRMEGRPSGLREVLGVSFVSLYGKGIVACGGVGNLSVLSGVRTPPLKQRPLPPAPPLQRDKVYIAPVVSDGNNITLYTRYYKENYYDNGTVTRLPVAFTMSPMALDLMPGIVEWYYEQPSKGAEVIAACSGATYIRTAMYAKAFAEDGPAWANYLDWTGRLMRGLDQHSIMLQVLRDDARDRFANALPFCHSVLSWLAPQAPRTKPDLYVAADGVPVFTAIPLKNGAGIEAIEKKVKDQRPAFVVAWCSCWELKGKELEALFARKKPYMEIVAPAQLAALYRAARNSDPGKDDG